LGIEKYEVGATRTIAGFMAVLLGEQGMYAIILHDEKVDRYYELNREYLKLNTRYIHVMPMKLLSRSEGANGTVNNHFEQEDETLVDTFKIATLFSWQEQPF
jgi:hypothetical protein